MQPTEQLKVPHGSCGCTKGGAAAGVRHGWQPGICRAIAGCSALAPQMSPALRTKAPCAVQLHDGATLCQVMQKPLKKNYISIGQSRGLTCAGPALMLCSV